jgi:hypothetical protein
MEGTVCFAGGSAIPTDDVDKALDPLRPIDTPNEASYVVQLNGYRVPCDGENNYRKEGDSYYIYAETGVKCGGTLYGHLLRVDADGSHTVEETEAIALDRSNNCPVPGRAPDGLLSQDRLTLLSPEIHPGDWLAEAAYFEAAAVAAFEHLGADLLRWGAPARLVARADRSASEEKRHAVACRQLALRYNRRPPQVELNRPRRRSLMELACENAREGLTREAFAALIANRQALYAKDAHVRQVMAIIADDETGHAEFSISLHRWLMTQLSKRELTLVSDTRARAVFELQNDDHRNYSPLVQDCLGLPTRSESRRLCEELFS